MNPLTILATVQEILSLVNVATATIDDGKKAYIAIARLFEKEAADVTQADLDELEAEITALSNRLQAPIGD